MHKNPRQRVYAYITGSKGILILEHPEHPEAGLQVPGGTVQEQEQPCVAVLREVKEETGLRGIEIVSLLGQCEFDMSLYGKNEIQLAWFYHLRCTQDAPDSWYFHEAHSVAQPIPFKLYWSPLPYAGDDLIATQGYMLTALHDTLQAGT